MPLVFWRSFLWTIENVITYPDYRRQGIGKRLIHHAF
ncbi:GNAT family N-acetyltransferase [Nostoc sp. ChiSLP03a]